MLNYLKYILKIFIVIITYRAYISINNNVSKLQLRQTLDIFLRD